MLEYVRKIKPFLAIWNLVKLSFEIKVPILPDTLPTDILTGAQTDVVNNLKETGAAQLKQIERDKDKQLAALADQYTSFKISQKGYNEEKAKIQYDADLKAIDAQIATQKAILETQENSLFADIASAEKI